MPKFHFEIVNRVTIKDPVGIDLKNQEQAKILAQEIANQIRIDAGDASARKIVVVDDEGVEIDKAAISSPGIVA
jgi:hypothetical protein